MGPVGLPVRWRGGRVSAGFAVPDGSPVSDAPVGVAAPVGFAGLVGLQEAPDDNAREEPARRHAGALLAELAALQRALLAGGDPSTVLGRLDTMLDVTPATGSPALLTLIAAVRLRARVELARRGAGAGR